MNKEIAMKKNNIALWAILFSLLICTKGFAQKSNSAQELFAQGLEYQDARNWWLASERFQEACKKNPAYTDAWYHLAQCVYELDEFDLAMNYLENAKKYSSGRVDILNLEGMAQISLGKFDDAEKTFNNILKKYPNNIEARFGLAELSLFKGKLTGAEGIYQDALHRESGNQKALLSLALVSASLGKNQASQKYVSQALTYHPESAEVYFVASYLAYRRGALDEAEKKAVSAIQIDGTYDDAYALLSLILFTQKRYSEVIDIADFEISHDRTNSLAWYIKGLSLEKLNKTEDALTAWSAGLDATPEDEIMRGAFEQLVAGTVEIEDKRRPSWAKHHIAKAAEYAKKFAGPEMRYEYQSALRLDPTNYVARKAFSTLLNNDGFNELYLEQLRFIKDNSLLETSYDKMKEQGKEIADKDKEAAVVHLSDTIEGYSSLLSDTIATKWDVNPFYLDKTRWRIGIYYATPKEPLLHPELPRVAAESLSTLFKGILGTTVRTYVGKGDSYGNAYADAHKNSYDYFVILSADETERDIKFDVTMYSARTGTESRKFSVYKTGNDRFASSLLRIRSEILSLLPVRAKIISRSGKDILVDIGRTEGITEGAVFQVVKKGEIRTKDTGAGVYFTDKAYLGSVKITKVGEEISEGELSDTGFYDRVNARDELVLLSVNEDTKDSSEVATDTAPQSNVNGDSVLDGNNGEKKNPLRGIDYEVARTPSLINMIRKL